MKKLFKTLLCLLIIGITMVFASACSFFDTDSPRQISEIRSEHRDGKTYIIVEYDGDDYEPDVFEIPDAAKGEKGDGIFEIESSLGADGKSTVLTIYYDDPAMPPQEVILPTGAFITDIETTRDEEARTTEITIHFSDPEMDPVTLTLEWGRDGKDGDRILNFSTDEELDENGNVVVHVVYMHYDDEKGEFVEKEETFTMPRGKEGNGIEKVEVNYQTYSLNDNNIYLDITFTDGTTTTINYPRANNWYTEAGTPGGNTGNVGDFYFDTKGYKLYRKQSSDSWQEIADFGTYKTTEHSVKFHYSTTEGESEKAVVFEEKIKHGESFYSSQKKLKYLIRKGNSITAQDDMKDDEEEPQSEGEEYEFLGWFTGPEMTDGKINPNNGQFTDLTVVSCDLDLYPRWRKVEKTE